MDSPRRVGALSLGAFFEHLIALGVCAGLLLKQLVNEPRVHSFLPTA
jgi:hypothetical protein